MENVRNNLISSEATSFFGNDCSFPFDSYALESTLRYIALKDAGGELDKVQSIKIATHQFDSSSNGNRIASDDRYELIISSARNGATMPMIDSEGWVELNSPPFPVSQFLSKVSETRVYVNKEIRRAVIFVRRATDKWIDTFCSSIPRVLSWRFGETLTEEEAALFTALNKRDSESFDAIINTACEGLDFKEYTLKHSLFGWSDGYIKTQIKNLTSRLESRHNDLEKFQSQLANLLNEIDNDSKTLFALQTQETDNKYEVYDFFKCHPQLHLHQVTRDNYGNVMTYAVTETIEYIDEEEFLRVYDNRYSAVGGANSEIKEILYNVFIKHKGLFKAEGMFRLSNLSSIEPVRHSRSGSFEFSHIPHPHIEGYACLGQNSQAINSALLAGNWDVALEQTIAAIKNLNFGDSTVISYFISYINDKLSRENYKVIIANNGVEMSLKEFLNYIRESNNEGTENG